MELRTNLALLLFAAILFFAGFVAGSPNYNCQEEYDSSAIGTSFTFSHKQKNQSEHYAEQSNCNSPKWYTALKRPDWLLVIVGAAGVVAALLTLRHLINSERGWIVVSIKEEPEPIQDGLAVLVLPTVRNYGKTVARIVKFCIHQVSVSDPRGLPPHPQYFQGGEVETSIILPPNVPLKPMAVAIPRSVFRDAVDANYCALYVYGYIDYIVLERDKKQTRFCFIYYPRLACTGPQKPGFYVGIDAPESYKACT